MRCRYFVDVRLLVLLACCVLTAAAVVVSSGAAEPTTGTLSVERARGTVTLDVRGSVLGRLGTGTIRITDLTPRDRFVPLVAGKKVMQERVSPRTVVYSGSGLRFRLIGGGYRIIARGAGLSLSAVGRGWVVLDAERKVATDDAGLYSLDGVDCGHEPELCTPLPDDPERFVLEARQNAGEGRTPTP